MLLSRVWQTHFPGHRVPVNEAKIVDDLSTKCRESDGELQAFNFVLLHTPSKENKDTSKRGAPIMVTEPKRACLPDTAHESTPPRPPEIGAPLWDWMGRKEDPHAEPAAPAVVEPVTSAPSTRIIRKLPAAIKPSALALELMNDKNYKFIMAAEEGRSK